MAIERVRPTKPLRTSGGWGSLGICQAGKTV